MAAHVPQVGDVGFSHNSGIMGKLIRIGEWLKLHRASHINHEFVVTEIVDGVPYIVQATIKGVIKSPLSEVSPGGYYFLFTPPAEVDIAKLVEFEEKQVGMKYGILTIIAIAIDILSWSWVPSFRGSRKSSWICSALANEGLRYAGWYWPWVNIYDMTPEEGLAALQSAGFQAHVFNATTNTDVFDGEEDAALAPTVNAHVVSRTLKESVYTPTHPQRGNSTPEFQASKDALEKESPTCYICGRTAEQSGAPLEGHHVHLEWSLANSADLAKIQTEYPNATDIAEWLDSVDNLLLLCARCHRSPLYGVHMVTMPAWIAQRYQLDGWDLVNGPNKTSNAVLDEDQSSWFPEH
jgi:hypothetical protein